MGSLVLSVGLWLRFDPETVSLLNGHGAPETFFIGEQKAVGQPITENQIELQSLVYSAMVSPNNIHGKVVFGPLRWHQIRPLHTLKPWQPTVRFLEHRSQFFVLGKIKSYFRFYDAQIHCPERSTVNTVYWHISMQSPLLLNKTVCMTVEIFPTTVDSTHTLIFSLSLSLSLSGSLFSLANTKNT